MFNGFELLGPKGGSVDFSQKLLNLFCILLDKTENHKILYLVIKSAINFKVLSSWGQNLLLVGFSQI